EFGRHVIEKAFEREPNIDCPVPAKSAAGRRIGQNALAQILYIVQVVDGVEHGAGIKNGHDPVTAVRPAALIAFAFDGGDAAILLHADLETYVRFRPAAVGDEGFFSVHDQTNRAAAFTREQSGYQFNVERLRTASEAAADVRLDD